MADARKGKKKLKAKGESLDVIKMTTVGDAAVGKTCLLMTYTSGKFPSEYVPTVFDNYSTNVMVRNNPIQLNLWDTAGDVENDRLRTLSYPGTDIFLCVFSLVDPASLDAIQEKFIPEVQQHVPGCQWLLVGCKSDLRNDADVIKRLKKKKLKPISKEQGEAKAAEWGAAGYQECSALTSKGVKSCFDTAVGLVVTRKDAEAKKKDGKCVIC